MSGGRPSSSSRGKGKGKGKGAKKGNKKQDTEVEGVGSGGGEREEEEEGEEEAAALVIAPPPPVEESTFFTTIMLLELGFESLMRVLSMMFLGLRDLARISRTSKSFYMETERATKSMLLELVLDVNIVPWVALAGKGPHMERLGCRRSFKRAWWELTRPRILLMGGEVGKIA